MENSTTVTPRSVGIKYGLISAVIFIIFFLALVLLGLNAFDSVWGWVRLVVAVVILVFAQKNFKDNAPGGYMTYGQGVGIGFWTCFISLIIVNVFMIIFVNFIDTTTMDAFYQKQTEDMEAKNMSQEQIDMAVSWTKKLFWYISAFMGLFFGMLVAVIVTIFTQKKNPERQSTL